MNNKPHKITDQQVQEYIDNGMMRDLASHKFNLKHDQFIRFPNIQMVPSDYAEKRGISLQAVTARIRDGKDIPGVKHIRDFGRFYLLHVCSEELETLVNTGNKKIIQK